MTVFVGSHDMSTWVHYLCWWVPVAHLLCFLFCLSSSCILPLQFSLTFIYVAIVSGLFILDCPYSFLWRLFMLPLSLYCPFLIAPTVSSHVYLCFHCLWIVHSWLPLQFFLTFIYVAIVSGLSILDYPYSFRSHLLMLPLSLDCPFSIAPTVSSDVYLCCHCLWIAPTVSSDVYLCFHCLWIVLSWLPLQFPLTFIYVAIVSGLPLQFPLTFIYVAIVSGLFILDCPSFLSRLFMFPLSLDCPFLIAPTVSSHVYLCCHCLLIVHSWLPLQFSLTFIYVAIVSGLFILDYPTVSSHVYLCCQCLWIVHSWLPLQFSLTFICCCPLSLDCPYSFLSRLFMLPLSLDCPFLIAPTVSSHVYLCCHCLLIVHSWLPLHFPLTFIYVPIVSWLSLDLCPFLILMPLQFPLTFIYVAIVSWLSFLIAPTLSHVYLCCHCLWIVHSWLPLQFPPTFLYVVNVSGLSILDCPYSFLSRLFIVSGLFILDCPYNFLSPLFMFPLSSWLPLQFPLTFIYVVHCLCLLSILVHSWLPLQFPLTFIYVAIVSGLSILDCPYSFLSRLFMLPLSLDCPFLIAPTVFSHVYLCAIVSWLSILDLWFSRLFMLPLSLGCPFLIAPTVSSHVYLCCHCLWIVHSWLPLQFPLTFIYVAIVSGLSILDCPYSFLSRLFMLPLSLYCPFLIAPTVFPLSLTRLFMLPLSLDCPFLIAPTVCSHVYLCCHCLCIVHSWLPLQFPLTFIYVAIVSVLSVLDCPYSFLSRLFMLPLSLDCPFLIASTVSSHLYLCCHCLLIVHSWLPLQFSLTFICVAIVSGLFILDCPYSFLWRLFMLPLSLYCPFLIAPTVSSHVYLCCHCLLIVHSWLPLQFPLTFIYVAIVSRLSILDCPYSFLSRLCMLPLSLDCSFLIAPTVFSHVYLCCHCLWIVHYWLPLQFSLTFINVAIVSGLSILDCPYSFLWRLFMLPLSLDCPYSFLWRLFMFPLSLDCPFLIAPTVSSHVYLCCHCLLIVHSWLPLQFSLTFIYVAIVSGLFILDYPTVSSHVYLCCQWLSIHCPYSFLSRLFVAIVSGLFILDCPYSFLSRLFMLPLSLDCPFLIAPTVSSHVYLCCHCLLIVHSWQLPLHFPLTFIYVPIVSWLSILDCPYSFLSRLFMLPLSLDCPFLIAPTVSSHVYLCCHCLLIVHSWLPLHFPLTFIYVSIVSGLSILDCPYSFLPRLFMLSMSLDCPFLIAPTVFSHVYLCCHCLWIVHSWLPLQFSLTFIYVSIVSGLSILDCPYSFLWRLFMLPLSLDCPFLIAPTVSSHVYLCCHCLWIVHSWLPLQFPLTFIYVAIVSGLSILDCPYSFLSRLFMLPLSLDCPFLIAPTVFSHVYLCCHCLLIVHSWLPLQFPLTFIYVAIVSGLSILDCPYSFLSRLFMLPLSLDCPFLIAPTVSSHVYLCCHCL